jgi:hypothetical protein
VAVCMRATNADGLIDFSNKQRQKASLAWTGLLCVCSGLDVDPGVLLTLRLGLLLKMRGGTAQGLE